MRRFAPSRTSAETVAFFVAEDWPEEPANGRLPEAIRVQFFSEDMDDRDARFDPVLYEVDLRQETIASLAPASEEEEEKEEPEGLLSVVLDLGRSSREPPHRAPRPPSLTHALCQDTYQTPRYALSIGKGMRGMRSAVVAILRGKRGHKPVRGD